MAPTIVITGATSGIGLATARAFSASHQLVLIGRNAAALESLSAEFPEAVVLAADLTRSADLEAIAGKVQQADVLVHSAGVLHMGTVEDSPAEAWSQSFEVNVVAPANLTRVLLPALRAAGGHVVMVNSGLGHRTIAGSGPYSASKHALRSLADALRQEEAPHGVRVTSIHPGRVSTPMQQQLHAWEGRDYDAEQWVKPEQVAQAIFEVVSLGRNAVIDTLNINPTA